jgi:hypothetical protein
MPTGKKWAYPASKHNINFVILDRTAGCGPACPVVWEGGGRPSPYPDWGPTSGSRSAYEAFCLELVLPGWVLNRAVPLDFVIVRLRPIHFRPDSYLCLLVFDYLLTFHYICSRWRNDHPGRLGKLSYRAKS